jgi:hypothetical protein
MDYYYYITHFVVLSIKVDNLSIFVDNCNTVTTMNGESKSNPV